MARWRPAFVIDVPVCVRYVRVCVFVPAEDDPERRIRRPRVRAYLARKKIKYNYRALCVSTFTSVCVRAHRLLFLHHLWRVCACICVCGNVCTILDGIWARHSIQVRVRPARVSVPATRVSVINFICKSRIRRLMAFARQACACVSLLGLCDLSVMTAHKMANKST